MHEIIDDLIPIAKAPEKIKIAEKTLRNWRSSGVYPTIFVKLGGKVFVDLGEYVKIIEDQKKKTREEAERLGL